MKIMRNLSAFAALCQRIAMNSLILVILAQKGKLKSQDFIHRNDFSDSALQTFRLSPKERIKSYALTALQFRSIVLPAVPSVIGIELIRIAMQTPIDELSKFYLHIFHLQTVGGKIADIAVVKTDEQSSLLFRSATGFDTGHNLFGK